MIQGGSITCRIVGPEARRVLARSADGASPTWFMLRLNLPYPVLFDRGVPVSVG